MRWISVIAAAIAILGVQAAPALAGGWGARLPQAHGAPVQQTLAHPQGQHGQAAWKPAPHDASAAHSHAFIDYGGPLLDQRPDPNFRNPYRPMFSLNATNPGQPHPYFQTRPDGFGYPTGRPSTVYMGNGMYFIPR